jgi:uncharacterized membrane protein YuzA (DUF378 family)
MDAYSSQTVYYQKFAFKIAMVLLVAGALVWLSIGIFGYNFLEKLAGRSMSRIVYILVGISALAVMFSRDFYLPFLGESVFPCSILKDQVPAGATIDQTIQVEPYQKVLYWAAEPENKGFETLKTWDQAYLEYANAGVATADSDGRVLLKVRPPQAYTVPMKGKLDSHIHYRVCDKKGFMSRIYTVFLNDGRIEAFVGSM